MTAMVNDRRQRYRAFIRRMDPTGDPGTAVTSGFYVEPPDGVGQRLAASLDIDQTGSHLVVGGIGSGKSTELIQVHRKLMESDVICFRVDVLAEQRSDDLVPGVLLGLAALAIAGWVETNRADIVTDEMLDAINRVSRLANGSWADIWDHAQNDFEPDDSVWVEGVIKRPGSNDTVDELKGALAPLVPAFPSGVVVLFDGLDRLEDLNAFVKIVRHDVPALRSIGIGSVVIGPQQLRLTAHNAILAHFTGFHLHGAAAFVTEEGQRFLAAVLRTRDTEELIPDDLLEKVATWSGGLLRDLISLAKSAGEEAYASGHDTISISDIDAAADQYGRGLLLGATAEMGTRLKDLVPPKADVKRLAPRSPAKAQPAFVLSTEVDIDMLVRRLIVEVPGVPVRYVPHPTLVPLVRKMGGGG